MEIISIKKYKYRNSESIKWKDKEFVPIEDTKMTIKMADNNSIECANFFLKSGETGKLENHICISTQAGCRQSCKFCTSGKNGFRRDLIDTEIVGQVLLMKNELNICFDNILFMGVGEPLDNIDNVKNAISKLMKMSKIFNENKKVSLATSGFPERIIELSRFEYPINLWISLHAATDDKRAKIMPSSAKRWPINELLKAARTYSEKRIQKVCLNYMVFQSFNNTDKDADELKNLLLGTEKNFMISLTAPNNNCLSYNAADDKGIESFKKLLISKNIKNEIVKFITAGKEINAGCGEFVFIPSEINKK